MSKHKEEPILVPRVEPTEPLALYWDAVRAAEATQRALTRLHKAAEAEGMEELLVPIFRAWETSKSAAELTRFIPEPENITPPLEIPRS